MPLYLVRRDNKESAQQKAAKIEKELQVKEREYYLRRQLIEVRAEEEKKKKEKEGQSPAIPETKALLTKIDEDVYLSF